MSEVNLIKFINIMNELGYKPKAPVNVEDFKDPQKRQAWKNEKGMWVFSFFHPKIQMNLIDVFVDEPIPFEAVDKQKKMIAAKGIQIPLLSIEHLKQLKRMAGRPQDLADIEALEEMEDE